MTDDIGQQLRKAAADKQWLDSLSKDDRKAEMARRQAIFAGNNDKITKAAAKDFWQRIVAGIKIGAVVIALLVAAFFVLNFLFGGSTSVERLSLGDCFMFPNEGETVERLDTPDCAEPHEGQIYYQFRPRSLSEADQETACVRNIDRITVVGAAADSTLQIGSFDVVEEGFDTVDRVLCYVAFDPVISTSVVDTE